MTDEERQKLCERLRYEARRGSPYTREAVDEIERLAKELVELKQTFKAAAIKLGDPRSRQHPERQRKF